MKQYIKYLACFSAILSVVSSNLTLDMELSTERAQRGETLTVRCDVTNPKKERFFIIWVRRIGGHDIEIGNNDILNKAFKESKRFDAEIAYEKPGDLGHVTFSLHISDLQASDIGQIGCKIAALNIEVFKEFVVEVPIDSIRLNAQHLDGSHAVTYQDGNEVMFDEGEVRKMYCIVKGSYPEPEVKMMIGDKDISDRFVKEVTLETGNSDDAFFPVGYTVSLTAEEFPIEYDFSRKKLRCVGTVPNTQFANTEESVGILIKLAGYKPKFICEEVQATALHEMNVNISCQVRADPAATDFKFSWATHHATTEGNETMQAGDQSGHFRADVLEGENEYEAQMVLTIDRVFVQHFRKYIFEAENEHGRVIHEITLERDRLAEAKQYELIDETTNQVGAVTGGVSSLVASSLALFLVIFLL